MMPFDFTDWGQGTEESSTPNRFMVLPHFYPIQLLFALLPIVSNLIEMAILSHFY